MISLHSKREASLWDEDIVHATRNSGITYMQLADAGVPIMGIYESIAKQMGITVDEVRKLKEAGGIGSDLAIFAILDTIKNDISGGELGSVMKAQMDQIPGLLSTLKSRPFELFQDLNIQPLQDFLKNLVTLTDTATVTGSRFKTALENSFGTVLGTVFNPLAKASEPEAILAWMASLEVKAQMFADWWQLNGPQLVNDAKAMMFGFLEAFKFIGNAIGWLGPILANLNVNFDATHSSSAAAIGKVGGLAAIFGVLNFMSFGLLGGLLKLGGSGLMSLIGWAWKAVSAAAALRGGFVFLARGFLAAIGPVGWVIAAISIIVPTLIWAYNHVEWFRNAVDTAWQFIKDSAQEAWAFIKQDIQNFVDWFVNLPATIAAAAKNIGSSIINGVSEGYQNAKATLGAAGDWLINNTLGRFQQELEVQSPSRKFGYLGKMSGVGYAQELMKTEPKIQSAVDYALPNADPISMDGESAQGFTARPVDGKSLAISNPQFVFQINKPVANLEQLIAEASPQLRAKFEAMLEGLVAEYEGMGGLEPI